MTHINNKAFTLIELLVVISIIGLLSSIVLVATKGSRDKARIAKGLEFSQTIQNTIGSEAVGIWDFDNCTAQDSSGYGNNGTINGAVCSSDTPYSAIGQGTGKNSLSFDGTDDYVNVANSTSLTPTSAITIESWVRIDTTPTNPNQYRGIVWKSSSTDPDQHVAYALALHTTTTHAKFFLSTDSPTLNGQNITSASALPLNTWSFITGTYESSTGTMKLYINGALSKTGSLTAGATIRVSTSAVRIGINHTADYFDGLVDDVRVYSQALTQSQIQQQYVEGLKTHNDLAISK